MRSGRRVKEEALTVQGRKQGVRAMPDPSQAVFLVCVGLLALFQCSLGNNLTWSKCRQSITLKEKSKRIGELLLDLTEIEFNIKIQEGSWRRQKLSKVKSQTKELK